MLTHHIALVAQTSRISPSELQQAAHALQKQVDRDLSPVWELRATVTPFENSRSVPPGHWPITIKDDIHEPGAEGYHTDRNHQPYALVRYSESWVLTASHELCEMLVDPWGNRLTAADSLIKDQGRVEYIVEVCDPCESARYAYLIDGLPVSDFYTPDYFVPVTHGKTRYSHTGSITRPLQVLREGYLSWTDPATGKWFQSTWFGAKPVIQEITARIEPLSGSLRERLDRIR